jgi:hypothetical protein
MKLRLVDYDKVRSDIHHPLHHILKQCEGVECTDPQAIQEKFHDLIVPQGYYAMVTTSYGYWIDFYEAIDPLEDYDIYHPFGGEINHNCGRGVYEYSKVGTVSAHSLSDAFAMAQNDLGTHWDQLGVRSTCVGDVIHVNGIYYMVTGTGFTVVSPTVVQYIDWSNHVKDPTDTYNAEDYA